MRNLTAACSSPVTEGMEVQTDTERVLDARRFIVDLLVSCHPLDCMTCEKTGDCALQNLAYELGVTGSGLKEKNTNIPSIPPTHLSSGITTNVYSVRDVSAYVTRFRGFRP